MKITKKRDGGRILDLSEEEARSLWCTIREGRRAMAREYANYGSSLDMDLLNNLPDHYEHIKRMEGIPS